MLSPENFVRREHIAVKKGIDEILVEICHKHHLVAYILCDWTPSDETSEAVAAWPIPLESFRGNEKIHLEVMLKDCIERYPQAHVHGIGDLGMPKIMRRLRNELQGISKTWFVPLQIDSDYYIFFGFPAMAVTTKTIPEQFIAELFGLLESKHSASKVTELSQRMEILEKYVKEVGHDIASAVQATVAKLRNISTGIIPSEFVAAKAAEAELEIWAAYRVSEGLGLTIEPNYQIRDFERFDLIEVCESAIGLHQSEANERHSNIQLKNTSPEIILVGDPYAFSQAIGHALSNAIKYSFGTTRVEVSVHADSEFAAIKISNLGIPLPTGTDLQKIWDFGYRGNDAKSRHVNGSGIGLYTFKKIVIGHHGFVHIQHDATTKLTTLSAKVPLATYLWKHQPELFIDGLAKG